MILRKRSPGTRREVYLYAYWYFGVSLEVLTSNQRAKSVKATPVGDVFLLRLRKIKEMDSIIDFSKSMLQLDIIIKLAQSGKPLSASDLAKELNTRKKAVLDAIRKLELKGLVTRIKSSEDLFEPSDMGKEYYEDLLLLIMGPHLVTKERGSRRFRGKVESRDLVKQLISTMYVYEVLLALGTSPRGELPSPLLSKITGITTQRLALYLDQYADPHSDIRLFRKYAKPSLIASILSKIGIKIRRTTHHYKLTKLGYDTYYRLPQHVKIKHNKVARLMMLLYKNAHPRIILYRIVSTLAMLNVITLILALLNLPLPLLFIPALTSLIMAFLMLMRF